ncbi:DUF4352 domain-containing protein [Actinopolymorpha sp. B17G11]|uniref:DUF4352 domain-containing protein n=1 Tax=Actinopolymorpha sp. B17G11 TaxID=3160861 RepID=UPI0032E44B2D
MGGSTAGGAEASEPKYPKGLGRVAIGIYAGLLGIMLGSASAGGDATTTVEAGAEPAPTVTVTVPADAPAAKPAAGKVEKPKVEKPKVEAPKGAGIGQAVKDGDFTFTVTKVENGPARIGSEFLGTEAQGKFVFVHLKIANHGTEAGTFFGDNQYLIDTKGRKASADGEAAIYLEESKSLFEEINPGNTLSGIVVFDIPKDAVPASLELHDSMLSDGVTVLVK